MELIINTDQWTFDVNGKVVPGKMLNTQQKFISADHTVAIQSEQIIAIRQLLWAKYGPLVDVLNVAQIPYDVKDLVIRCISYEAACFMRDYLQDQLFKEQESKAQQSKVESEKKKENPPETQPQQ